MTYKYNPFWQQRIRETVRHALNVHPRLTALRVDLRFPDVPAATDAAVISRFINALKARIDAYQKRKHREGKRVHPTTLHYVWAREFGECKGKKHYHLMLLVNRDTWCRAGDYRAPESLAGMIKQAWCSALGVDVGWRQQWREGKLLLPSSESPQLLPVTLDAAAEQPESLAEDPETLSISCEVTFRHGTLRFNGNVSEKLLTLLIQELKR